MEKSGGQRTNNACFPRHRTTNRKTTPHTPKLKTPSLDTLTTEKRSKQSGNQIAAKQLLPRINKTGEQ